MSYFTAVSPSKLQIRNRNLCYIVDSDTCTAIDRYRPICWSRAVVPYHSASPFPFAARKVLIYSVYPAETRSHSCPGKEYPTDYTGR